MLGSELRFKLVPPTGSFTILLLVELTSLLSAPDRGLNFVPVYLAMMEEAALGGPLSFGSS